MPSRRTIIDAHPKKGGLSKFGYHADDKASVRRAALLRGAKREGYGPLIRRLSLEATYLKNSSPKYSRIFKADQRWLSKKYEELKRKRSTASRTRSRLGHSRYSLAKPRQSMSVEDDEENEESAFDSDDEMESSSGNTLPDDSDEGETENHGPHCKCEEHSDDEEGEESSDMESVGKSDEEEEEFSSDDESK